MYFRSADKAVERAITEDLEREEPVLKQPLLLCLIYAGCSQIKSHQGQTAAGKR